MALDREGVSRLPRAEAWEQAAAGLNIVASALTVSLVVNLTAMLCVLPAILASSAELWQFVDVLVPLCNMAILVPMVIGVSRFAAAPEPAGARTATSAAFFLLLLCFLPDGYRVFLAIHAPAQPLQPETTGDSALLVSLAREVGYMVGLAALLRGMSRVADWLGDRKDARRAIWLGAGLLVSMSIAFVGRRGLWGQGADLDLLLLFVGAVAVLVVLMQFALLAFHLARRIRSAVADGPPLARAVARVAHED